MYMISPNKRHPDSRYMSLFVVYRDNLVRDALVFSSEKASTELIKSTLSIPRKLTIDT